MIASRNVALPHGRNKKTTNSAVAATEAIVVGEPAREFPSQLLKIIKTGPGVQSDRDQEERSGQKAGKPANTVQRRTLHSSVRGAAYHGLKLRRCPTQRQRDHGLGQGSEKFAGHR
jgi:hypothetical protein